MRWIIIFFVFVLSIANSLAQNNNADSTKAAKQLDMIDVVHKLFKLNATPSTRTQLDSELEVKPFSHPTIKSDSSKKKSDKVLLAFFPAVGYTLQTGVTAILSMNFSFYAGNHDSTNLSSIAVNPTRSLTYKQFLLPVIFNIWSKKNKLDFIGDWRYYKYPTYTYGLGGHTQLSDADMINYSYIRVYQEVLKHITSYFYGGMSYNLDYHFDIKEEGKGKDFEAYNGNATKSVASGLSVNLIYDSRKNINYPMNAFYGNISCRYNSTYLGSDGNFASAILEFKKYIKLFRHSNNVLAFWNLNWVTFGGTVPYFDFPSTGWDAYSNTGRGYIQGRLRGPDMIYLESEYRFGITRNGLLGAVVFVNAQSVSEAHTNNFETILPGTGFGVRLKVNKRSGVNIALDYGFGINNSQGFFFNLSEVF